MENIENILEGIKKYEKAEGDLKSDFPPILDEYLRSVSKTGDPLLPWNVIKKFIKNKLEVVITEFFNFYGGEDLVEAKNLPSFSYIHTKNRILKHFDTFVGAPFTIQRLCEILVDPMRHYKRTDKFLRGLEKNILVVTHVEPGRNKRKCESPHPFLANGMQGDQSISHLSQPKKNSVSYTVSTNSDNFEDERNAVGNLTASYLVGILNKDYESNGPVNKRPRLDHIGENMSNHNGEPGSSSSIIIPQNDTDKVTNSLETEIVDQSQEDDTCDSSFRLGEGSVEPGNVCSASESQDKDLVDHRECEDVRAVVNELSQMKEKCRVEKMSEAIREESPGKSTCHTDTSPEKERCLSMEHIPQAIDKSTEEEADGYTPGVKDFQCSVAPKSPTNVGACGDMEETQPEPIASIDSSQEDSPSMLDSSQCSTNQENIEPNTVDSFSDDLDPTVNQALKDDETIEDNEDECKDDEKLQEGDSISSHDVPVSKVESSNNINEFDTDVDSEASVSHSSGSPDSAQDVMPESICNFQEKQSRQNDQESNSEAIPSEQESRENPENNISEDTPATSKGDYNSVVDSTSFSSSSECSVPLANESISDSTFSDIADESNSSIPEQTSSPDSNCGSINEQVSQSPEVDDAVVCSSNRLENEASAECSSDSVSSDIKMDKESECEQSAMEDTPEAELTSTSLRSKECDGNDDEDSCSSSNI